MTGSALQLNTWLAVLMGIEGGKCHVPNVAVLLDALHHPLRTAMVGIFGQADNTKIRLEVVLQIHEANDVIGIDPILQDDPGAPCHDLSGPCLFDERASAFVISRNTNWDVD